jgi:hypothetical protein
MRIKECAAALLCAGCLACSEAKEIPPLERQSVTPPQAQATPERVQGCLRAGEASGTFVLTARATDTGTTAATYQLLGPDNLREHVGRRVEVTGTIVSGQVATAQGATLPAEDRAKGTSGTPTVQSTTKIDLKRLQVTSVTPVGGDCDDGR